MMTTLATLTLATLDDVTHRHLRNDRLINYCLPFCVISTVSSRCKKVENALEDVALVAGTQQNLSNLYSLDIYDVTQLGFAPFV